MRIWDLIRDNIQAANLRFLLESNMNFGNPRMGRSGVFSIDTAGTINYNYYGVGIGMSYSSLFIAAATPNQSTVIYDPGNRYFVACEDYSEGEVIDFHEAVINAAEIDFPPIGGMFEVTFEQDGTFSVAKK